MLDVGRPREKGCKSLRWGIFDAHWGNPSRHSLSRLASCHSLRLLTMPQPQTFYPFRLQACLLRGVSSESIPQQRRGLTGAIRIVATTVEVQPRSSITWAATVSTLDAFHPRCLLRKWLDRSSCRTCFFQTTLTHGDGLWASSGRRQRLEAKQQQNWLRLRILEIGRERNQVIQFQVQVESVLKIIDA